MMINDRAKGEIIFKGYDRRRKARTDEGRRRDRIEVDETDK